MCPCRAGASGELLGKLVAHPAAQTVEALERLASMENVTLEDHATAALAVEWHRSGLDFADALHLAASRREEAFATFDGPLLRAAARLAGPALTLEP